MNDKETIEEKSFSILESFKRDGERLKLSLNTKSDTERIEVLEEKINELINHVNKVTKALNDSLQAIMKIVSHLGKNP